MINEVIIYGAHTFIGFSLCEKCINENIEVKAVLAKSENEIQERLVEERFMHIGRNALLEVIDQNKYVDLNLNSTDLIIYCFEGSNNSILATKEYEQFIKMVDTAKELKIPIAVISSFDNIQSEEDRQQIIEYEDYVLNTLKTISIIKHPNLYGPFQPDVEEFLLNRDYLQQEPLLFINDAVNAIFQLLDKLNIGNFYYLVSKSDDELFDLEQYCDIKRYDAFCEVKKIVICEPTDIKEGERLIVDFLAKYQQIIYGKER